MKTTNGGEKQLQKIRNESHSAFAMRKQWLFFFFDFKISVHLVAIFSLVCNLA